MSVILETRLDGNKVIQKRLRSDGKIETRTNYPESHCVREYAGGVTVQIGDHISNWDSATTKEVIPPHETIRVEEETSEYSMQGCIEMTGTYDIDETLIDDED